jgi:ribosome-binding protein aMBF1 (putative translation factor)
MGVIRSHREEIKAGVVGKYIQMVLRARQMEGWSCDEKEGG